MTSVLITGGTVNITSSVYGIYAYESCIYISGGNVTVSSNYDAIYGEYGVSIEGGTVSAKCTNTSDGDDTYRAINPGSADFILSSGLEVKASTEPGGTLGSFVLGNLEMYDYITIKKAPPAGGYPMGEVDGDGNVNAMDSYSLKLILAGVYK